MPLSNPYRYAGYYQDSESGLYYLQSRYYNPRTARFLTEDTASGKYTDPLSLNKYTYCHNQPVTGYDPDGHFLHIAVGAAIGAVVGGAISAYSQYKSTGKVSFKKTIGAAAEGAVVGGVGAATAGASLGVTVAAGAAAGAAGNTANQLISTGKVDKKQVAVSAIGGVAGSAGAKLAGAAVNAGSKAASQAISKAAGNAGKQAAAKAGSSILGKTIAASAKGGIVGASAGASADLAMQIAKDKKHDIRNVNWKEVGGSALLGGGIGAGVGAASQTEFGQKVSASQAKWDKKLNAGINKLFGGAKSKSRGTDFYVTKDGTVIPANKVKHNSLYDRLEVEIKSGKAVRPKNAVNDWDEFLGPDQTDIDPFTGEKSMDRIWSGDGKRSIRFGEHEMNGMGTKNFHYHRETWHDDYVVNELQRIQKQ